MISSQVASGYGDIKVGHINWKHYNTIKKKAMEQEFSWSGLVLSLSIAFFIVILASFVLSSFYTVLQVNQINIGESKNRAIYYESVLNTETDSSWYFSRFG